MPIITISRGSYSRGKEVAEKVAEELGYDCISRDILLTASKEFNIPEIGLVRALHDAPSVLNRFTHGAERFISYIRKELLEQVQSGDVVYHGLAGHYFLLDIPHVIKVRIIANMDMRVEEEVRRENITPEEALFTLQKDDEERRKWGLRLYNIDTWDSSLYDLTLHINQLSVDDAVSILCDVARKDAFQVTEESQQILDDKLLAARVHAILVKTIPKAEVKAKSGKVYIGSSDSAMSMNKDVHKDVLHSVKNIDGVKEVVLFGYDNQSDGGAVNPFMNL